MCVPAHDSWVHHMRSVIKGPFMFVLLESPNHDCGFNFGRFNHVFNWTITYRRDSDLVLNYGGFEPVSGGNDFNPARINLKRKLVFWLVNHKGSPGGRDRYVHELEKHIKVHKHGGGTGNHCPPETRTLYGWECKAKLSKQYKFYLAFENSVCKDYATEKFYDVMKYDVVPVVYGLANYSALAPPHSYIDVRDFKSPKALGEYLTYLDKNDEEYLKYFKWRENYRVTDLRVAINKVLCDMCERVNHMEELRKTAHSAEELELWWRGTQKDRT
ncbi:Alpha-1_3-fucosyltransferase, partial [Caligus rogercresseyi]